MKPIRRKRAIVLVDGEHHPAAVGDALTGLAGAYEIVALVFCGGGEKAGAAVLADPKAHYGFPLVFGDSPARALQTALARHGGEVVIDFADEPVVAVGEKLRLAAVAMASGLSYEAPGMSLEPLKRHTVDFDGPKLAVIGTGKRTGKTAVCGHLAGLIGDAGGSPAIVSMGRGGPSSPRLAEPTTGLDELLALADRGVHAASDYLEDAVLAGVPAIGCRRVGGGPGGQTGPTNFVEGARMAARLDGIDCLLFEGSGATIPPVVADRTVCVAGSLEQADTLAGPLRLIESELVLVYADQPGTLRAAQRWAGGEVVGFELVSAPVSELPGDARVAFFSTRAERLEGVDPLVVSTNLARRAQLEADLDAAVKAGCTHFLTELKAAAIDVVATRARREAIEIVFVRNRPVARDADLDGILLGLYEQAMTQPVAAADTAGD
ncbi:MAG: hypothetical protein WAO61_03450 [Solirubrobacterales bacterium]